MIILQCSVVIMKFFDYLTPMFNYVISCLHTLSNKYRRKAYLRSIEHENRCTTYTFLPLIENVYIYRTIKAFQLKSTRAMNELKYYYSKCQCHF